MKLKTLIGAVATSALLGPLSASAFQVFMQDFENGIDNSVGGPEQIIADSSTRTVSCPASLCPFSETGKNWDIHHQSTNPWAGSNGNGTPGAGPATGKYNPNMSGQVLGHVYANYNHHEDNYYEIGGIDLASDWDDINLMFDFDSWISSDVDGFAVSFSTNGGSSWDLLNPTSASDMQYRNLGGGDESLNHLSGYNNGSNSSNGDDCGSIGTIGGSQVCGYDGHENGAKMAGVAMFDLTDLAGNTIDLRFSFASNYSSGNNSCSSLSTTTSCRTEEGINIDNIKITAICENGNQGPGCDGGPGTGIPEPTSLALMMLGATAVYRRRKQVTNS